MHMSGSDIRLAGLDYRVVRELGRGAGSVITLVADNATGRFYALKTVARASEDDDVHLEQIQHEFRVLGRLGHANVIRAFDLRLKKSWLKTVGAELLLEYVDGGTLDDYNVELARQRPEGKSPESLARRRLRRLVVAFHQLAGALAHCHRRGVHHGDVKPMNVLVNSDHKVKLIDFGTAWIKGQPKDRVQGTLDYMAPEQASERRVDHATDVYNYGATLYRVLTGQYFNIGIPKVSTRSHRNPRRVAECDPRVPPALDALVAACLEHRPDDRPASMREVQDALAPIAESLGVRVHDRH